MNHTEFFACFLHRRKSLPNEVQTLRNFLVIFWARRQPRDLRSIGEAARGGNTHQGMPGGPDAPWWVLAPSVPRSTACSPYKFPNIPKTLCVTLDEKLRLRKPLYPQETNRDPFLVLCRRGGGIITGGHHHHHPGGLHDEEGVVLPRGWGYVPIAMCCISLSLSLVFLRWNDLDVNTGFVAIDESYGVFPLSIFSMNWVFPLSFCCWIESLMIWEHLICVLHEDICSDIGIYNWFTWCMLLWSTCGFRDIEIYA
jgi:hypothetical protein